MNQSLISIIVPVYNVERYLEQCVNSVLAQTYTNFELILVNDGSTDTSGELCEQIKLSDARIKVFHKKNGGLSSARNHGIVKSKGVYVIFLDSDDYWAEAQALEHLINVAKKTKADVVRGEYKEVSEDGKEIYSPTIDKELLLLEGRCLNNETFARKILSRGHFSWLFLIKKSEIADIRFNEEQKFQEDIEFNIRFFSVPRNCVYTSLRFYAYRKRDNSIMSTPKVDNLKYSFLLSDTWHHYEELIHNDRGLQQFYRYNSIMMYYWTLNTLSTDNYFNNRESIIKDLSLKKRQKEVSCWARSNNQHYPFLIYVAPNLGVRWLRLHNKIKGYILAQGSRCKAFIKHLIKR